MTPDNKGGQQQVIRMEEWLGKMKGNIKQL